MMMTTMILMMIIMIMMILMMMILMMMIMSPYTRNDHRADPPPALYPMRPLSTLSWFSVILSRWPRLRHTLHIHHWSGR